ncbi:DUF6270 domain-containing protein [Corynebacterium casei]|uniref:DUF6270 domain-containing protein n=1 Tax=Corynebacterium casei TaxID=160386 RepID=UPI003FD64BE6
MANSVFIWGSCVARDVLRVTGKFELSGYVGRQSLISGMNPGLKDPGPSGLKHNFQDRSLRGDIRSNGRSKIRQYTDATDAFIIDLATERRGVYPVENGYFSRTAELAKSRMLPKYKHGKVIEFGTRQHVQLFRSAVEALKSELTGVGLESRVCVINHPFSSETDAGYKFRPSLGKLASEWNKLFPMYHGILADAGFKVFDPPPSELVMASENHAWGRTIDHYIDETYYFWASQIEEFINELPAIKAYN